MPDLPNRYDLRAGIEGLSRVLNPMIVEPTFQVIRVPDLAQFAMLPTISPNMLQRDDASGEEGYVDFQFSTYTNKMVHWKRGTPRTAFLGGGGGTLRLNARTVQVTETLGAQQLFPFLPEAPLQLDEMMITANRVIQSFNIASVRDRTDFVLIPMVENSLTTWDDLPLFDEDHKHTNSDQGLFSNDIRAGAAIKHMTNITVPTRASEPNPTVEELYAELKVLMTYLMLITQDVQNVQMHKVDQLWDIEVLVQDVTTLTRLQELNGIERAKFIAPATQSENDLNQFFNRISLTVNRSKTLVSGRELEYFVIPKITLLDRQTGVTPENPLGLSTWNPVPRLLTFAVLRDVTAGGVDTNWDKWMAPTTADIGMWTIWVSGGGFGTEGLRFNPDSTP